MALNSSNRELIVADLVGTMLGPKYGLREVFHEKMNPWKLYLSGVLAPADAQEDEDAENEPTDTAEKENDDQTVSSVDDPDDYTPSLSSTSQTRSFGISFTVTTDQKCVNLDCCITWARYKWYIDWNEIPKDYEDGELVGWYDEELLEEIRKRHLKQKEKTSQNDESGRVLKKNADDEDKEEFDIINDPSKLPEMMPEVLGGWKRDPRYLILKGLKICPQEAIIKLDQKNFSKAEIINETKYSFDEDDEDFRIYIRINESNLDLPGNKNYYNISIYFINDASPIDPFKLPEPKRKEMIGIKTEAFIFQPQIRIKCHRGVEVISPDLKSEYEEIKFEEVEDSFFNFDNDDIEDFYVKNKCIFNKKPPEDKILSLLYRKRRQKAKGHMCGAIWSNIDPEMPYEINNEVYTPVQKGPFFWIDSQLLDNKDRAYFTVPDVRSEFVPVLPISAPNFNWRRNLRLNPNINEVIGDELKTDEEKKNTFIDPLFVANNCWDMGVLKTTFNELIKEYEKWLIAQCQIINKDPYFMQNTQMAQVAKYNLRTHLMIFKRIKQGLDILYQNADARLAFCFANKVIQLQNEFSRREKFFWRPFQIAFLLLSIPCIVNPYDKSRNLVDLIWFPTGGGKTEAYLLVSAFTMGYRRRKAYEDTETLPYVENGTYLISRYTLRLLTIQQFRRANLTTVTADYLRVKGLQNDLDANLIGWLPPIFKNFQDTAVKEQFGYLLNSINWIWGKHRFSVGLWVGAKLTPNFLEKRWVGRGKPPLRGALDALRVSFVEEYKTKSEHEEDDDLDQDIGPQSGPNVNATELGSISHGSRMGYVRKLIEPMNYGVGDPAQIVRCPVCSSLLALPKSKDEYLRSEIELHILVKVLDPTIIKNSNDLESSVNSTLAAMNWALFPFKVKLMKTPHSFKNPDIYSINLQFKSSGDMKYESEKVKNWWDEFRNNNQKFNLLCVDIRNPGYYYLKFQEKPYDFEIRCANPECALNNANWAEATNFPTDITYWTKSSDQWFLNRPEISRSVPISAFSVDDQIYRYLPTLIIGTVDKFAQLPFNDKVGSMFGHIDYGAPIFGFFKDNVLIKILEKKVNTLIQTYPMDSIYPPEIILQDELHLISGPLGSMVGIYETIIDELSKRKINDKIIKPKYIASTATIRAGEQQVTCLYNRDFSIFPPHGINENDAFFTINKTHHALKDDIPGRLYIGICCPGKSAQTPLSHIWGSLFQKVYEIANLIIDSSISYDQKNTLLAKLDSYWTIVGYHNAISELASTRATYTQEYVDWMKLFYGKDNYRAFDAKLDEPIELSSRTDSIVLPQYFERLESKLMLINGTTPIQKLEEPVSGVLTTSIFGTGVDVGRLGIMVVNAQPKTTASYIQATGRIGRILGGISIILLKAGRPRDLDHYEQFSGYHRALYKYVEPITVMPFSLNCMKIAFGPLSVALLRQSKYIENLKIPPDWRGRNTGLYEILKLNRKTSLKPLPSGAFSKPGDSIEFEKIINIFKSRYENQNKDRKPLKEHFDAAVEDLIEKSNKWINLADKITDKKEFVYNEPTINNAPSKSVVLGDPQHEVAAGKKISGLTTPKIKIIFHNTPNSLRGVETMTTFGIYATYKKTKEEVERITSMRKKKAAKKPAAKKKKRKPPLKKKPLGGFRR